MADYDRRRFLKTSCAALASLPAAACVARPLPVRSPYASAIPDGQLSTTVNDVHSQLNRTQVDAIVRPERIEQLQAAVARAKAQGQAISVAGGRHAMGGQQFAEGALLVDTRSLNRVLAFDAERGVVSVEGGFLKLKQLHDPEERFQSTWYRHYREMFDPVVEDDNGSRQWPEHRPTRA